MHPTLEVVRGSPAGKRYNLVEDEVLIGRSHDCRVVIDDASASRKHARLLLEGSSFVIEDLNSRNRTYVNDTLLEGRLPLQDQDKVRVGDTLLLFRESAPGAIPRADDDSVTVLGILDPRPGTLTMSRVNAEAKLRAILQITQSLGRTLDLGTLLATMLDGLFEIFPQSSRALVLLLAGDKLVPRAVKRRRGEEGSVRYSKTIVDKVMTERKAILSQDVSHDERFPATESIAELCIRSIMCAPLLSREMRALGVVQLEAPYGGATFRADDVQILASVANQVSLVIEYVGLHKRILRQSRLQREMDFAEEVQRDFLPETMPELKGYGFWSYYLAAGKVGGDYYDFLCLPNGKRVVLLGDVSGKGVPAALRMARASSVCKVALLSHLDDLAQAMSDINREFCSASRKGAFMTLAVCVIDPETHEITIANAGHPSPLVRRVDGTVDDLVDREASGCPLGVLLDFQYKTTTGTLGPGEIVVLYSDGITEARNSKEELYTVERVRRQVTAMKRKGPAETGRALIEDVRRHAGDWEQNDDIALVVLGRQSDPNGPCTR